MKTDRRAFEASAPGRLDIMGGFADYSGSLVLQLPIAQRTTVTLKLRDDYKCIIDSATPVESLHASVDFREYLENAQVNYAFAQRKFGKSKNEAWIAYVLGCVLVLKKERDIDFKGGDFSIRTDIPLGKGVSSSAALEVATMKALRAAFGLTFEGTELPRFAQCAENLVVGAPCGLMDQLTSFFGQPDKLLPILCQPDKIMKPIELLSSVSFIGIDSGIRHSVGGSSYTQVRCAAFMGYTILAHAAGAEENDILHAIERNDFSGLPFGGYLCNIQVEEFENKFKTILPDRVFGHDFLKQYPGTIDRATEIGEKTWYDVLPCTAHPIYENQRVHQFMEQLQRVNTVDAEVDAPMRKMGELMYEAHESYSRCGLGSERTDEIVGLAKNSMKDGIFGAKITGGGNGGTVCLLVTGREGKDAVRELHLQLERKYNASLALFEI